MKRIQAVSSFFLTGVVSMCFSGCKPVALKPGDRAPEFINVEWIQSNPLSLGSLQGKVVFIRWWTDECIFCIQSADALNEWYEMYSDSGLVVIGMYHPKPDPKECEAEDVSELALDKGFRFPIAIDDQWDNLKRYWLDSGQKPFTSVSFLLDRKGIIRYIHPGGEYHKEAAVGHEKCVEDYRTITAAIQEYLHSK